MDASLDYFLTGEFAAGFVAFVATLVGAYSILGKLGLFVGFLPALVQYGMISTLYLRGESIADLVMTWCVIALGFVFFGTLVFCIDEKG
ncbi:MAG: hypothetical protein HZC02_02060 [Candidatus Levybacteria bacterium]|nr:hypothetical protein [Candidatus Levybacteria bacterium]